METINYTPDNEVSKHTVDAFTHLGIAAAEFYKGYQAAIDEMIKANYASGLTRPTEKKLTVEEIQAMMKVGSAAIKRLNAKYGPCWGGILGCVQMALMHGEITEEEVDAAMRAMGISPKETQTEGDDTPTEDNEE